MFGFGAQQYVRVQERQILEACEGMKKGGEVVDVHRASLQRQLGDGGSQIPKDGANFLVL